MALNLNPSDFHFFGALKAPMEKDVGVISWLLKKWLQGHNSNWYKKKIDTLVSHWHKAVEVDGDYVEKCEYYSHLVILHVQRIT
jgi:hypothetical protein